MYNRSFWLNDQGLGSAREAIEMRLSVTLPDLAEEWEFQAERYPTKGTPGITYGNSGDGVERLLYYDSTGKLAGFLHYYLRDIFETSDGSPLPGTSGASRSGAPLEKAGNFFVAVAPGYQKAGIGIKLLREATKRWSVNFEQQRYTEAGARLVQKFLSDSGHPAVIQKFT